MFLVLPFKHNYTETGDWVTTGYFMPAYITMHKKGYVGDRGEYFLSKLKAFYEERRASITDPLTLLEHKQEQCFTAEEAFSAEGVNKFNKIKIAEQIIAINIKKEAPPIQRGYMLFTYNSPIRKRENISGVKFIPNNNGPIYILNPPVWEQSDDPSVINNLYVAGIDGIDIGASETSDLTRNPSKFCTVIKKRIYGMGEPEYVAYYLDRPLDIRDAYVQTIGLMMWYAAKGNLEATRLSLLTYARDNKFMLYFLKRPRVCYGDNIKRRTANQYGTTATTAMIEHGTDLVRDYVEDYCHNIWFIEFLNLLNKYTDENKGSFDIVAAMQMAEIADEELSDVNPKSAEPPQTVHQDIGYYIDERGYRRFGIIPRKQQSVNVNFSFLFPYENKNITTNPYYND